MFHKCFILSPWENGWLLRDLAFFLSLSSSLHRDHNFKKGGISMNRSIVRKRGGGLLSIYPYSLRIFNCTWKNIYIQYVQYQRKKYVYPHEQNWEKISWRVFLVICKITGWWLALFFYFSTFTDFLQWLHVTFIIGEKSVTFCLFV